MGQIAGMEVVKKIKYLGIEVEDRFGLYDAHRGKIVEKGRKMSNLTYSVIEKSCHRVIIGKAYWKGVVLPSVLYGAEVMEMRESDLQGLQRTENGALRRMLGAPRYATIAAMRGEVGIGTMRSRIARGRIQYLRRKVQGNNELIKGVIGAMRGDGERWWKQSEKYMEWAGIGFGELGGVTAREVRRRVASRVEGEWR